MSVQHQYRAFLHTDIKIFEQNLTSLNCNKCLDKIVWQDLCKFEFTRFHKLPTLQTSVKSGTSGDLQRLAFLSVADSLFKMQHNLLYIRQPSRTHPACAAAELIIFILCQCIYRMHNACVYVAKFFHDL